MKTLFLVMALVFLTGNISFSENTKHEGLQKAVFAGGCFWCVESDFEKVDGVLEAVSGYTGGAGKDPNYYNYGKKGHIEVVQITYDSSKVTYQELLDYLWRHIDPTDAGGQFVDRGVYYRSAIFYNSEEEKKIAEKSKQDLNQKGIFKNPIVTDILPLEEFYPTEDYHQNYYKKHPIRYKTYRIASGRDKFLKKSWRNYKNVKEGKMDQKYKKLSEEELKIKLTPEQYKVTQKDGTERPFSNAYWDNKKEGIYVDIVSGEPLFSSKDKFKSGTGWPSFTKPLESENVKEESDISLFMKRIEVRSKYGDSHLGHLFDDGPAPTGLRYCINSASLRFISKEELNKEGYDQYRGLFKSEKAN